MGLLQFHKYQGTGNDFVMINNMDGQIQLDRNQISHLCDRKFGVGADGVILLESSKHSDFYVNYYNSDGSQSFCGNGSRCSVLFAVREEIISGLECVFDAIDGRHNGFLLSDGSVKVSMGDVAGIEATENGCVLDTGSPHYVRITEDVENINLIQEARSVRYNERFSNEGINVNFFESLGGNSVKMRTYERGVEDETLSCGTGVTAVAISLAKVNGFHKFEISTLGGELGVEFNKTDHMFHDIFLLGPVEEVFSGTI